jgi:protein phosphatase
MALVVGLALVVVGFYRLWNERRPRPAPSLRLLAPDRDEDPPLEDEPPAPVKPASVRPAPAPRSERPASMPPIRRSKTPATIATPAELPSLLAASGDDDITLVTLAPAAEAPPEAAPAATPDGVPKARTVYEDDDEENPRAKPAAVPIVYDQDAAVDEPTRADPLILVSAAAGTDRGRRRRRNEDSLLVLEDHHLFVVADGMGGHAGGDVASQLAVDIIGEAFRKNLFEGEPYEDVPRRGAELALAIQMANKAIYDCSRTDAGYAGMGTTVVSARFSPKKQRVYIGHVGDSRAYRLRSGALTQLTTDHTMAAEGMTGPLAAHLNRAVGILPGVKVDLIIARPLPNDVYLLCSDGLTKMVAEEEIERVLVAASAASDLDRAVSQLVEQANAAGGRDNITVILVQVADVRAMRAAAAAHSLT